MDEKRAKDALERAGLGERMKTLPDQLDTNVGREFEENGVTFSGGEKQKMAIARAIYKDAPFVIMDELSRNAKYMQALTKWSAIRRQFTFPTALRPAASAKIFWYLTRARSSSAAAMRNWRIRKGYTGNCGTHRRSITHKRGRLLKTE